MSPDLEEQLQRQFPDLFVSVEGELISIECLDGWFHVIRRLCEELIMFDQPYGQSHFVNIKQKYGKLSVSADNFSMDMYEILRYHERKSYNYCEVCGDDGGYLKVKGQHMTRCQPCAVAQFPELTTYAVLDPDTIPQGYPEEAIESHSYCSSSHDGSNE